MRASATWDKSQPAGWTAPGAGASELISEQAPARSERIKRIVIDDNEMALFIFILQDINREGAVSKETTPMARSLLLYLLSAGVNVAAAEDLGFLIVAHVESPFVVVRGWCHYPVFPGWSRG